MFIPNLLPAMQVSLGLNCWCLSEIFSFNGLRYNLNENTERKHHLDGSVLFQELSAEVQVNCGG